MKQSQKRQVAKSVLTKVSIRKIENLDNYENNWVLIKNYLKKL